MKKILLVFLSIFIVACDSRPRSVPADQNSDLPSSPQEQQMLPTDVGNGSEQSSSSILRYPQYRMEIELSSGWEVESSDSSGFILRETGKDEAYQLSFRKNVFQDAELAGEALSKEFQSSNIKTSTERAIDQALIKVKAEQGGSLVKGAAANRVATLEIAALEDATGLEEILRGIRLSENPCEAFEENRWITYLREVNGAQEQEVIFQVIEIDEANDQLRIHRSDRGVATYRCSHIMSLNALLGKDVQTEAQVINRDLDEQIIVNGRSFEVARVVESFQMGRGPFSDDILIESFYSFDVPLMGVVKRQLTTREGMREEWTFLDTGVGSIERAEGTQFVSDSSFDVRTAQFLTSLRSETPRIRLEGARRLLNDSDPRAAFQVYEDLLQDLNGTTLNEIQLKVRDQARVGRALTGLMVFLDQPEYQQFLRDLGFLPYLPSYQFFGDQGYLARFSEINRLEDQLDYDLYREDLELYRALFRRVEDLRQMNRSFLPFQTEAGSMTATKDIFRQRLILRSKDYRSIAKKFRSDLEKIIQDLEQLDFVSSQLNFVIPSGLHHGTSTIHLWAAEILLVKASLELIVSQLWYQEAYADLVTPVSDWFYTFSDELYYGKISPRDRLRKMRDFRDDFNRNAFRLVNPHAALTSGSYVKAALESLHLAGGLVLETLIPTQYRATSASDEVLRLSLSHLEDALRSFDEPGEGWVALSQHDEKLEINLKTFFTNPFDIRIKKKVPLVLTREHYEGSYEFRFSGQFGEAVLDHFSLREWSSDIDSFFPGVSFCSLEDYEKNYEAFDLAGLKWNERVSE